MYLLHSCRYCRLFRRILDALSTPLVIADEPINGMAMVTQVTEMSKWTQF